MKYTLRKNKGFDSTLLNFWKSKRKITSTVVQRVRVPSCKIYHNISPFKKRNNNNVRSLLDWKLFPTGSGPRLSLLVSDTRGQNNNRKCEHIKVLISEFLQVSTSHIFRLLRPSGITFETFIKIIILKGRIHLFSCVWCGLHRNKNREITNRKKLSQIWNCVFKNL